VSALAVFPPTCAVC